MLREDFLLQAAANGDFKSVKGFLDTGVSVNSKDTRNRTPLMCALESAKPHCKPVVKELLARGADVNIADVNNRTALLIAAEKRHMPTLVQTILDHGADPNHEDMNKFTALVMASRAGHLTGVKALIAKGAFIDQQTSTKDTPLKMAVYHSQLAVVKELLKNGADVDIADTYGITALKYARQHRKSEYVNLFLKEQSKRAIAAANEKLEKQQKPAAALQEVHSALAKDPTNQELIALQTVFVAEAAKAENLWKEQLRQMELKMKLMQAQLEEAKAIGQKKDLVLQQVRAQLVAVTERVKMQQREAAVEQKVDYPMATAAITTPKAVKAPKFGRKKKHVTALSVATSPIPTARQVRLSNKATDEYQVCQSSHMSAKSGARTERRKRRKKKTPHPQR